MNFLGRLEQVRDLAAKGHCAQQIAQEVGSDAIYIRLVARRNGIKLTRPVSDKRIDITGQVFGNLTAVSRIAGRSWRCKCACGGEKTVPTGALRAGTVISCGCRYQTGDQSRTHGQTKTSEYRIWTAMKQRCTNPNAEGFKDYGSRGITVCQRWIDSFDNFLADMGPRPSRKHSINRVNNDGNYEPSNCCWATQIEQMNNTRRQFFVVYRNEKMTVAQLHRNHPCSVSVGTLAARIRTGWDLDKALSTPAARRS